MKNLLHFAVTKIRVKESKLIDEAAMLRLSQSRNTDEFIKLLSELNYPTNENIDDALTCELIETYKYTKEALGTMDIIYPFLLKYDLFNISVYLKAELSNKDFDIKKLPFVPLGNIEISTLVKALTNRESISPSEFMKAFLEAREVYINTLDISLAQIYLEKTCYEYILSQIINLDSDFILKYYKTEIDLKNLIFSLRLKKINSEELINRVLISGGYIPITAIIKAFNAGISDLKELFSKSLDNKIIDEVFLKFEAGKSFAEIEKQLNKILVKLIDKTRITPFGIDPIIAYILRKESEIKNIRAIYYKVLSNYS